MYLYRRNGGTHLYAFNLCMAYIQYYMGHLITDPNYKRTDFADEEMRYEIKKALNNHPFNDYYQQHEHETVMDGNELRVPGMRDETVTIKGTGGKNALFINVIAKEQACPIRMELTAGTGDISVSLIQSRALSETSELVDARNTVKKLYTSSK